MKLFNRARDEQAEHAAETTVDEPDVEQPRQSAYTEPKGKPTPKRRDAQSGKRGPVLPPPTNQREAAKRTKQLRGNKQERRVAAAERRKKMEEGDDRYVMPRDRGPLRRYVRDVVDAKRNFAGLFMPLALLIFVSLFTPSPRIQQIAVLVVTVLLAMMVIEGVVNGVSINRKVRAKFPKVKERGFSLGWYAFVRSTQIRKLRMPKPQVKPGEKVE